MGTNPEPQPMVEWLFTFTDPASAAKRFSILATIVASLVANVLGNNATPTPAIQFLVCICVAILLAYPVLTSSFDKAEASLVCPVWAVAGAYAFMALLYFLAWTNREPTFVGYDAITDFLGTLLFAVAWILMANKDLSSHQKNTERFTAAVLVTFALFAAWKKAIFDSGESVDRSEVESARLIVNLCNGAVFLCFFAQLKRVAPLPDPVSNALIVLFGCAQISAQGRDCLHLKEGVCMLPSLQAITAYSIEWMLLIGKVAVGVYVSYAYFHFRPAAVLDKVEFVPIILSKSTEETDGSTNG